MNYGSSFLVDSPKSTVGDDDLRSLDRTMLVFTDVDHVDLVPSSQVCWLTEASHPRTLGHKEQSRDIHMLKKIPLILVKEQRANSQQCGSR